MTRSRKQRYGACALMIGAFALSACSPGEAGTPNADDPAMAPDTTPAQIPPSTPSAPDDTLSVDTSLTSDQEPRPAGGEWLQDEVRLASRACGGGTLACAIEITRFVPYATDDHPRNHALVAFGRGWRLSPAYDLTPSRARSLERRDLAMTVGAHGRWASRANLLSEAPRFGWSRDEANRVIDDMAAIVDRRWSAAIREHGGSEADCAAVAGAFLYEGFERPAAE
jgi:hypothetical protein